MLRHRFLVYCCILILVLCFSQPAHAYVGPGAGFAVLSSFLMVFIAFLLGFINLFLWPIRYVVQLIVGRNAYKNAKADNVLIVGLDGLDPELTKKFMAEGKLPNLKNLREKGTFCELGTTFPAVSPVAWSSFQTGVNPARHNIFDFLTPDRRTYLPQLSSAYIGGPARTFKVGKYVIPLGKPRIKLLRKSTPFWGLLSRRGVFCSILRVPITFPPEKVNGVLLSAMCVPDLKGTQGSFTYYTSNGDGAGSHTGGVRILIEKNGTTLSSYLPGPPNPLSRSREELQVPFRVDLDTEKKQARLRLNGQEVLLQQGVYSDWLKVTFKAGFGLKIRGICRFLLKQVGPEFELYVTPINIDPYKASLPISFPRVYSTYLSKLQGNFATLGLAEDTWALNERVIDESAFLKQTYDIHDERERMFFSALDRLDKGLLVCVFDATDRIQHTFFRYLERDHPANRDKDTRQFAGAIEKVYAKADELVGQVMQKTDDKTFLIVMSDHGFKPFKRGVNLNSWLRQKGYLHLKDDSGGGEYFANVDWSRTKAYALGLGGLYLNLKGREANGTIAPGAEAHALKKELIGKLRGLKDNGNGSVAINEVFDSSEVYSGPYVAAGPDLIVGYNPGYRASWKVVTGDTTEEVFTDNTKSWSGDHCIDPRQVPGVLFCNRKINVESPRIVDIAPTVLQLFGVEVPKYMDGRSLLSDDSGSEGS